MFNRRGPAGPCGAAFRYWHQSTMPLSFTSWNSALAPRVTLTDGSANGSCNSGVVCSGSHGKVERPTFGRWSEATFRTKDTFRRPRKKAMDVKSSLLCCYRIHIWLPIQEPETYHQTWKKLLDWIKENEHYSTVMQSERLLSWGEVYSKQLFNSMTALNETLFPTDSAIGSIWVLTLGSVEFVIIAQCSSVDENDYLNPISKWKPAFWWWQFTEANKISNPFSYSKIKALSTCLHIKTIKSEMEQSNRLRFYCT